MDALNAVAPPPTLGESRVRVKFNVVDREAERKNVDAIKYESAKLIDFCEEGKSDVNNKEWNPQAKAEANRLWALAQTHFEEAAMWAVKAATYGL
ncbi:MAG: hypothetical protein JST87_05340 [Bacteroidetes bacterium]|nr:hypothetical protein [Bacteroidota bacterium]